MRSKKSIPTLYKVPLWAPPGINATPGLTAGKQIARIIKVALSKGRNFSGYVVALDLVCDNGASGIVRLSIFSDVSKEWITKRSLGLVNQVLVAGGMAGCPDSEWDKLARRLRNVWFSVDLRLRGDFLNLESLEVIGHSASITDEEQESESAPDADEGENDPDDVDCDRSDEESTPDDN